MSDALPHRTLRRIFAVVMEEAKANPKLAQKLARAIGQAPAGERQQAKPARRSFDASQLHAINILRLHGESALRGKLEEVRAIADLQLVARASGLVLSGALGARPTRADLIAAIIAAAKHYDAQRSAATA